MNGKSLCVTRTRSYADFVLDVLSNTGTASFPRLAAVTNLMLHSIDVVLSICYYANCEAHLGQQSYAARGLGAECTGMMGRANHGEGKEQLVI